MKKKLLLLVFLCFLGTAFCQNSKIPFTKGVNLTDYFELYCFESDLMPRMYKYDEADFDCLKSMGVDVFRLIVRFNLLMDPAPTGTINPAVLQKIDEICDWAEKNQVYLVIDDHSNNDGLNDLDFETLKLHLESVWSQLAAHFCNRSEYIIYEVLNEPYFNTPETTQKYYDLQGEIIKLIRSYDTKHTIVVTGTECASMDTLIKMKPYSDKNLIYSFHYYESALFTQQGKGDLGEGFDTLQGVPFPYDKNRMPKNVNLPKDSYIAWLWNYYPQQGTAKYIKDRIKQVKKWADKNKVNVWCGEIGCEPKYAAEADRVEYLKAIVSALNTYNIPYCIYGTEMFSEQKELPIFPDDIQEDVLKALNFTMPEKSLVEKTNISINDISKEPYVIFDGCIGKGTKVTHCGVMKVTGDDKNPTNLFLSVSYTPGQDGHDMNITFPENIKTQIAEDYDSLYLSFKVKFENKKQAFKIIFRDNEDGKNLLPWDSEYTVKASDYSIGKWIEIEFPISKTKEGYGTWSNLQQTWFESRGEFDWKRINSFTIKFSNDENDSYTGNVSVDDIILKKK